VQWVRASCNTLGGGEIVYKTCACTLPEGPGGVTGRMVVQLQCYQCYHYYRPTGLAKVFNITVLPTVLTIRPNGDIYKLDPKEVDRETEPVKNWARVGYRWRRFFGYDGAVAINHCVKTR
jgi:hypothetical protein